jgi:hypothetical protein
MKLALLSAALLAAFPAFGDPLVPRDFVPFRRPFQLIENEVIPETKPGPDHYLEQLKKYLSSDDCDANTARWVVEFARQFRERFAEDPWAEREKNQRLLTALRARKLALACWMAGEEELAYRMMFEGWVCGPDPEDRFDPWFGEFVWASGRADRALAELDDLRPPLAADLVPLKRMHVLRAAGRGKEALDETREVWPAPPHSLMELAVEQGAWKEADRFAIGAIEDEKRRDVVRELFRLLTLPADARWHPPMKNRMLQLLFGDEFGFVQQALAQMDQSGSRAEDLRALAQDAVVARTYEARLTQALANGEPVPLDVMQRFFRYPDLLPDRGRATQLALALAEVPRHRRIQSDPPDGVAGDVPRWLAAEALVEMGRGHEAFKALKPVLASESGPADVKILGYNHEELVVAWRQAMALARVAWPEASLAERVDKLAAIMGQADPAKRARDAIALAEQHGAALDESAMLDFLWLPLHELACSGSVPEEMMEAANKVLAARAGTPKGKLRLESYGRIAAPANSIPWEALDHSPKLSVSFESMPTAQVIGEARDFGAHFEALPGRWDPTSIDFVVLDGLAGVKALLESRKDTEAPVRLMRALILRLCLDDSLTEQRCSVTWHKSSPRINDTSSEEVYPSELILICGATWNFPAEWLPRYAGACWRPNTGYADSERLERASRAFERAGDHAGAALLQRLYIVRSIRPDSMDVVDPKIAARAVKLDAMVAAKRGDKAAALRGMRSLLRLRPYQPQEATAVLAAYTGPDPAAFKAEAAKAADTYWSAKLIEIPESKIYASWKRTWDERLK